MRFHLTLMQPEGFDCFNEVVETVVYGLRALGHPTTYQPNETVADAQNIVLGAHLCPPEVEFPEGTVLYNLEPITSGAPIPPRLTAHYPIWDYSPRNTAIWHEHHIDADYVPIGYVPELARIRPVISPDIDVLFYGTLSERRARVLQQLQEMRLNVLSLLAFGSPRDSFIARAKVVLNMHHSDTPRLFEIVRVSYLLANRKAVVTESSDDFPSRLLDGVRIASYNDLAVACRELVHDTARRMRYQEQGFAKFASAREPDILRVALAHLDARPRNGALLPVPQ